MKKRFVTVEDTGEKLPLYARKPTGRLIPCPGEAHKPEIGGMIDHCGHCMPRWGRIEEEAPFSIDDARAMAPVAVNLHDLPEEKMNEVLDARQTTAVVDKRRGSTSYYNVWVIR